MAHTTPPTPSSSALKQGIVAAGLSTRALKALLV